MGTVEAEKFAQRLCGDFVRRIARRGSRAFIVTQFKYPDGDFMNLYPEGRGDTFSVSDLGDTMFKCRMGGVKLTSTRMKWIDTICGIHGIRMEDSVFRKDVRQDHFGTDCLSFCEAISKISTLEYDSERRLRSFLPAQLDGLIHDCVEPVRGVTRKWTHPTLDPKQSYPVDYRFNGIGEPRHVFHVVSGDKSTLVAAVCGFLKLQGIFAPTLAVVSTDADLGPHEVDRLQRAATSIKFGIAGNEDEIIRFATSTAAAN